MPTAIWHAMQNLNHNFGMRCERRVPLSHNVGAQPLTFAAYMKKDLIKTRPITQLEIGIKKLANLTGIMSETYV